MILAHCALNGQSGHEAGRQLLAALYRQKTGMNLPPILLSDWGKPYFADSPYHFSISHTPKHAFCVLAGENIAIDAEEADRPIHLRLAEKVLSPSEKLRFDAAADKRLALLKLWVLKEAAAKLSGQGLRGYPNHTDFSPDDPRVQEIDGCIVAILKAFPSGEGGSPQG